MMNQKQATVSTILAVLEERGVSYELGCDTPISGVLTDKDRADIRAALKAMFIDGSVGFKDEATSDKYLGDDAELNKYVSGLVNNWIRKHKEFNCGKAYKVKNPGSRAHTKDDQLKALTQLLSSSDVIGNDEAIASVTEAIEVRKAEIAQEKAKDVVINTEALPEHLRKLVTSQ